MIVGIGSDLIDIRRIERTLERFGERFIKRVFTQEERAKADRRGGQPATYAKRFAAKEAVSKALGSGIRMGVAWREMGVVNLPSGQPTMVLTGGARLRLDALIPDGHRGIIHLTMTDDHPWAQAFVVIEARADVPHFEPFIARESV
ncbi:MAG: holo-ACP synthase [Pseudomonadota bacterium]